MLLHITLSHAGPAFSVMRHLRWLRNILIEETGEKPFQGWHSSKNFVLWWKKKTWLEHRAVVSLCLSHSNAQLMYCSREILGQRWRSSVEFSVCTSIKINLSKSRETNIQPGLIKPRYLCCNHVLPLSQWRAESETKTWCKILQLWHNSCFCYYFYLCLQHNQT